MSSHFPTLKPHQVITLLKQKGFVEKRVTGSHHIFRHTTEGTMVCVPIHGNRDLKQGTLRSILKQAGISVADFKK